MNVLAVGAHYDDVELGCSGALLKHVEAGDRVFVVVVTDSGYRDPKGVEVRSTSIAYEEGGAADKIMGVELTCLDYETFQVPFAEDLTRTINQFVDDNDIDTVYCHWVHDLHRDHQYAGKCTIMASRHVPRVLMYRSNYYDTYETFSGKFYVDVSGVMETKIRVIESHKSELERVRYKWVEFIRRQNANSGQRIGVDYAEQFEAVRYLL